MDYKQNGGNRYNSGYPQNNRRNFSDRPNEQEKKINPIEEFESNNTFQQEWIKTGANQAMVEYAEKAGKFMAQNKLSTSQIRNVYGEIKRIQLKGIDSQEGYMAFMLLKPKVAYAEGRNKSYGLSLFKKIFNKAWVEVERDKKCYSNFCALIEAILAYHKAFGGKD